MTPSPEKAAPIPALRPCPFCEALEDRLLCSVEGEDDYFNVGCEECDCRTAWFDSRAAAYTAWNRRADRKARPSLPDSREERIREDERLEGADEAEMIIASGRRMAARIGAEFVIDQQKLADFRARARQGGNNG